MKRLGELPIPMARRLRYYKKANICARAIQGLVPLARIYLQSLPRLERMKSPIDLHRKLAFQHIEELPRLAVKMPLFCRSRRHAFLDYAEIFAAQQMPAITDIPPRIMFGVRRADRFIHSGILPCFLGGFLSRFPSSISSAAISRPPRFVRKNHGVDIAALSGDIRVCELLAELVHLFRARRSQ